ncbi:imidazoleglycerol-phosphate dehydratase [Gottfriedia luciferensis]|nr:imidazoleglycerol-phosphate dehydratase [Gottfriedia luciferensis]
MTSKNGSKGSKNQNAPELHGQTPSSGDNNKGKDYRSKKGSKSKIELH